MTTLSQTDLANLALSKIGAQSITNITDQTSTSAIACNTNWGISFLETARSAPWNCLRKTAVLQQTTNPTVSPSASTLTPVPIPWAPTTAYAANINLTFGGNTYATNYAFTSSFNFTNDLTSGALSLIDIPTLYPFSNYGDTGNQYVSGWSYAYLLPSDFLLVVMLNDTWCYGQWGNRNTELFELQGPLLMTNRSQVLLKYTANISDTTQYDPLFTNALSFLLASKVASSLRKDDGRLQMQLLEAYKQALSDARTVNANEGSPSRNNVMRRSLWVKSRYSSTNG